MVAPLLSIKTDAAGIRLQLGCVTKSLVVALKKIVGAEREKIVKPEKTFLRAGTRSITKIDPPRGANYGDYIKRHGSFCA